jgi:putative hemolysin
MTDLTSRFQVSTATGGADLLAAQRLRYDVFARELGAAGPMVDHENRLECDRFDPYATHFVLRDTNRATDDQVIGVYRVMNETAADTAGQFYCEDEYDLTCLKTSGHRLLELGRSCLHPDYRGGPAMMHLWAALADFVTHEGIDLLFGVASFHGTDAQALAAPLSLLHARHLAPPEFRVTAKAPGAQAMDLIAVDDIDRVAAMRATPALIKAYLRLGGLVGEGAFVDHDFNTVDICLILPTDAVNALPRSPTQKGAA